MLHIMVNVLCMFVQMWGAGVESYLSEEKVKSSGLDKLHLKSL